MGWAKLLGATNRSVSTQSSLRNMGLSLARGKSGLVFEHLQLLAGGARINDVKLGVDAERRLQPFFGLGRLPQPAGDHTGVKKQQCILGAGAQRMVDSITRFLVFAVLV